MQGQGWKIGLIVFLLAGSLWYLYPTIDLYMMSPAEREEMAKSDPQEWIKLQHKAMKLGLDLRGGMRLVLQVDKSKLNPDEASDAVDRAKEILRNRVDQFGVAEPLIAVQGGDRIVVELPGISDPDRARELIGQTALLEFKLVESPELSSVLIERIDRALEAAVWFGYHRDSRYVGDFIARGEFESLFGDDSAKADTSAKPPNCRPNTGIGPWTDTGAVLPPQIPKESPLSSLLDPSGGYGFMVARDEVPLVRMLLARPDVQKLVPRRMSNSPGEPVPNSLADWKSSVSISSRGRSNSKAST